MKSIVTGLMLFVTLYCTAQAIPILREADKIRIKEAMIISSKYGDQLFSGFSKVPFAIILISDSTDFLINHPYPSGDFKLLGRDETLQADIYYRKSQFNPHLLATFPAVNGLSCIVVGTPENTNKNSTEWVITLLHEHFHQYQNADPNYYQQVNELNLSGGDQTGMWMLNYPFPYDSTIVKMQYESYAKALSLAVKSVNLQDFDQKLNKYLIERKKFQDILPAPDYRYFSFQLWQEGLARYVEYKFLMVLKNYKTSKELIALKDYQPFIAIKDSMYRNETKGLLTNKLDEIQRVCFYSVGFAEGILLDRLNKTWKNNYLKKKFFVERYR